MRVETEPDSHQGNKVDYAVTQDRLFGVELALKQDSHISHLSRNLVSNDTDRYGNELFRVAKAEGDSYGCSIDEVMQ